MKSFESQSPREDGDSVRVSVAIIPMAPAACDTPMHLGAGNTRYARVSMCETSAK